MSSTIIEGGCNCGAIRYSISGEPSVVVICHCSNCRRQSGSSFSVNIVIKPDVIKIDGDLATYEDKNTESGAPVLRQFCSLCGSPIRSVSSAQMEVSIVKAGSTDDPSLFAPAMHIWTQSALPWVPLPADLPCFERNPG
jgi:hypothetical protein